MEGSSHFTGQQDIPRNWDEVEAYEDDVLELIGQTIRKNTVRYGIAYAAELSRRQAVLGFPGTIPLTIAQEAFVDSLPINANCIGVHRMGSSTEKGFEGAGLVERAAVSLLGEMLNATSVEGYICQGGTEANIVGLWCGRNYLRSLSRLGSDARICVISSILAHYSIPKACDLLSLPVAESESPMVSTRSGNRICYPDDFDGLHYVFGSRPSGALNEDSIKNLLNDAYASGVRRFILILLAGGTETGVVDEIEQICKFLDSWERDHSAEVYVHVDASFGGFIAPFLRNPIPIGFVHRKVCSVAVDGHKMGLTPYPTGAYLCREGFLDYVGTSAPYLSAGKDKTLSGSRPAGSAAAVLAALVSEKKKGYELRAEQCMAAKNFFIERLEPWCRTRAYAGYYPGDLNVVGVWVELPQLDVLLELHRQLPTSDWPYELEWSPLDVPEELLFWPPKEHNFPNLKDDLWEKVGLWNLSRQGKLAYAKILAEWIELDHRYVLVSSRLPKTLNDPQSEIVTVFKFALMPHRWTQERTTANNVIGNFLKQFTELLDRVADLPKAVGESR